MKRVIIDNTIIIIGLMVRVLANGPGDRGSLTGRFIPKTQTIVLVTSFLNTQQHAVTYQK